MAGEIKLKDLTTLRTPVRNMFTRALNDLKAELERKSPDIDKVNKDFRRVEIHNEKLCMLNKKIEDKLLEAETEEKELEKEYSKCTDYLVEYADACAKVEALDKKDKAALSSSDVKEDKDKSYRLPRLEFKPFSGEPREWLGFWSQFRSVDRRSDLPPETKFQHLIQITAEKSVAREVVESFPPSAENYPKVISYLKSRFGDEEMLVEVYIRDLMEHILERARSGVTPSIVKIYDQLETQIRALETLGVTREKYAAMLYPLVESALPSETVRTWERVQSQISVEDRKVDKLTRLMDFLKVEVKGEVRVTMAKSAFKSESVSSPSESKVKCKREASKETTFAAIELSNSTSGKSCIFCSKSNHSSQDCYGAQKMTLEERQKIVRDKRACFACLVPGHSFKKCRSKHKCPVCSKKHYAIVCNGIKPETQQQKTGNTNQNVGVQEVSTPSCANNSSGGIYLQTITVRVKGPSGISTVRALFDSGSQKSYITKRLAQAIGAKATGVCKLTHNLFGGGELKEQQHNEYTVEISSYDKSFSTQVKVLNQEKICGYVPNITNEDVIYDLKQKGIQALDYAPGTQEIHMLIGADLYGSLLTGNIQRLKNGPVAVETHLGWTIIGKTEGTELEAYNSMLVTSLHTTMEIQDLWKLDVIGITEPIENKSRDEIIESAKKHFKKTVTQTKEGRYEVALPWLEHHPPVPVNRALAERRLRNATKKLDDMQMYHNYDSIFRDWLKERIIEQVPDSWENCSYLPHRPVLKESATTPIRPVFNASAKEKGSSSVNDCLEKGDNLIELIPDLITKFRKKKYGVMADIRKAFLQIGIRQQDRDMLRFLWWNDDRSEVIVFRHCRVVFGLTCSPFLLSATIAHHLEKEQYHKNETAFLLKNSFYVDNCLVSLDSKEEVVKFIEEASRIMQEGKFELRDWMWNNPESMVNQPTPLLGMNWNMNDDTISVDLRSVMKSIGDEPTKRNVLSACHRIFDPIGFTAPSTLPMKKLIQEAWCRKKAWDELLPDEMVKKLDKWRSQLHALGPIKLTRWMVPGGGRDVQLHIFSDASKDAYATCAFLRSEINGQVFVKMIATKNRLSTIKKITIPRLELLACLIGARLGSSLERILSDYNLRTVYWTDSSNALYWIQQNERWGDFVGNRVREIRDLTSMAEWRHIPGRDNPADLPSRGTLPKNLLLSRWWEGPKWLLNPESKWPASVVQHDMEIILSERRKSVISALDTKKEKFVPLYMKFYEGKVTLTYPRILRVIAWILRWKRNMEYEPQHLSQEEMDRAELCLIKLIQSERISEDHKIVKTLHAVKDKSGAWRVRTRVINREDKQDFRLPLLLPHLHPITNMIIEHVHQSNFHCGVQALMTTLREKYWIPQSRRLCRSVVHTCHRCRRFEVKRASVPEAPLPVNRVKDCVPFEVTGIDLGGPLYLVGKQKAWFVVFTCAVFRAVHLELVTSLSSRALMGALERFMARRGNPSVIYSDNGTNLVGVFNELRKTSFNLKWIFNPPGAPWWGGWFERIVGMTKRLLLRLLGKGVADYESLMTILVNCEKVINSRPLTYVSEDAADLIPLTPNMFLREMKQDGVMDLTDLNVDFGANFKKRKSTLKEFRKRFRSEYLGLLVHRDNRRKQHNLKVDDVVLLEQEHKKQITWPIGRILEIIPSADGHSRVVKVKTSSGVFLRPIQRIFPLEVPQRVEVPKEKDDKSVSGPEEEKNDTPEPKEEKQVATRSGRQVKKTVRFKFD